MPVQTLSTIPRPGAAVSHSTLHALPPVTAGGYWRCCQCTKPNDTNRSSCDNCGHVKCDGC